MAQSRKSTPKKVETLTHPEATRVNIPTAEYQALVNETDQASVRVAYERRNRDLDPQLVWRGKDEQDWSDLVVQTPPLYIQEKVHPKVLIDDLVCESKQRPGAPEENEQINLFDDFNGTPDGADKTDFYQHEQNWTNRMILGDSLQVMASLAEREGLRGKVQCIYLDPPYGIRFNSNFQWSTTSRDVKDGNASHITREPEQVKAFRDTWRDGIHSYLTYLRDRLTVARDLLTDSGSLFVQIGDENVHRVRSLLDEIFGADNCVCEITVAKTTSATSELLAPVCDYVVWYAKSIAAVKYRQLYLKKVAGQAGATGYTKVRLINGAIRPLTTSEKEGRSSIDPGSRIFATDNITSQRPPGDFPVDFKGKSFRPVKGYWKTGTVGFPRLLRAERVADTTGGRLSYVRYIEDFPAFPITNIWTDTVGQNQFGGDKVYVVQTANKIIERCILMSSDPGDLVLDPTCGSGTTATVAEQWGRRWITIDTSRVALALARARIMGGRYPYYLLADSREGQRKEGEASSAAPSSRPTSGNIRHGFVYERVPHITLKSIANNSEIDVIWERSTAPLDSIRDELNRLVERQWQEWEVPMAADPNWSSTALSLHERWLLGRDERQREIDASILASAEFEPLYDRPYEDNKTVRVAGPFTVESLSPHRTLSVDESDGLIGALSLDQPESPFPQMVLENLRTSGVQQAHKDDRIVFTTLVAWPGYLICGEGRYLEDSHEKRAAIFVGPEFGTVQRPDLVAAAREAGDGGFDVLISCAFNYEAHTTEFTKLGRVPVVKARMNADLHMADDLKNTGKGNLFVVFGEPDIELIHEEGLFRVLLHGVDVFHPSTGEVRSDGPDGIACWFIDTDYNEESFFVRQAYFLGANDPYGALKTTLRAEIDPEAWASLNGEISRLFDKPSSGRIAVKVINHLGDEVMKVFRVD